jgi:hypothetical protein
MQLNAGLPLRLSSMGLAMEDRRPVSTVSFGPAADDSIHLTEGNEENEERSGSSRGIIG